MMMDDELGESDAASKDVVRLIVRACATRGSRRAARGGVPWPIFYSSWSTETLKPAERLGSNGERYKIIVPRRIGPALVSERLWQQTGCRDVIQTLARERKHAFALERAVFLTALHRLFGGGSDRAADR